MLFLLMQPFCVFFVWLIGALSGRRAVANVVNIKLTGIPNLSYLPMEHFKPNGASQTYKLDEPISHFRVVE